MLRFLSSLFTSHDDDNHGVPDTLLEAAIDRAVDGTDRRLRALGNYRARLREPVAIAVRHLIELVGQLPRATEIAPGCYGSDSRLRAAFASPNHLAEVLGQCQTIKDFLRTCCGPPPDAIFGLLTMSLQERTVLGMEMDGDTLRRDVMQTSISFTQHRFVAPADSERMARRELKKRGFDFLLEKALEGIVAAKERRGSLAKNRQLLRRKLDAMKSGQWGLEHAFFEGDEYCPCVEALEADIAAIDEELGQSAGIALGLDESLSHIAETLSRPEDWLALNPLRLNLDYRGILQGDADATDALELSEISSVQGQRRIVLLGWIPRDQLPEPKDSIRLGQAYLG